MVKVHTELSGFVRDIEQPGLILNTNKAGYEAILAARQRDKEINNVTKEINSLKREVRELKEIVLALNQKVI